MVLIVEKKGNVKKTVAKIVALQKKKSFDPYQFLGKIKNWGKDSVEYQRSVRNEW